MAWSVAIGDEEIEVQAAYRGPALAVEVLGRKLGFQLEACSDDPTAFALLHADGRRERLRIARDGDTVHIRLRGRTHCVRVLEPLARARGDARAREGKESLVAAMPGVVIEVVAAVGEIVAPGATLLVIESMKLQTRIVSERGGRVVELCHGLGESFEQGAVLARVEDEEDA